MSRQKFSEIVVLSLISSLAYADSSTGMKVSGQTSLWRLSKVIGVDVYNARNEKIGKIDDVMIDHGGDVKSVIIAVGPYTGSGERLVGVGLDVLRFPHRPISGTFPTDAANDRWYPDHAILNTTKDKLLAMPPVIF